MLIALDISVKGFNRFVFSFFRCLVDMSCNWALAVLKRVFDLENEFFIWFFNHN